MNTHQSFCLEQADKARAEAEGTRLDNVRERYLRSEDAWREMAARAERNETNRAKAAADKAERQADDPTGGIAHPQF